MMPRARQTFGTAVDDEARAAVYVDRFQRGLRSLAGRVDVGGREGQCGEAEG